ncbi:hypothetical protein F2Q69_00041756 [Brassica cretica]|uniref:Uncharacterized protein n=1 Tax=Brassica cretica TaxID=69181 RepID=A0A8S9N5H0_BRACR|nr:hypothetical protein F2Q69_00041756 [Brassica cretica]
MHMITQMLLFFRLLKSNQLMLRYDGSTRSILFATEYHEAYDAKKKKFGMKHPEQNIDVAVFRELHEGFGSKLFGDERDELLVESQELLQRGEIELDITQEIKK